ncbi:MAG: hypothetical protein PHU25_13675 [Deltaproteobacteria bacterium]|nr:hypothetical protein [Deltaproteobacteria bacterium]
MTTRAKVFIATAAFLSTALVLIHYPGSMSNDSYGHLYQGRTGVYWDYQPPAISVLFGFLDRIHPGPALLLALDVCLCVWGACGIIFWLGASPAWSAALCALLFAYPPNSVILGMIWRDITGLGTFLVALWLLILGTRAGRPWAKRACFTGSALFIFCGLLLRANAAASAWPCAAALFFFVLSRPRAWPRRAAAAVGLGFVALLLAVPVAGGINSSVITHRVYSLQVPVNNHLARLSVRMQENLFPKERFPSLTLGDLRNLDRKYPLPDGLYQFLWTAYYDRSDARFPRLDEKGLEILKGKALKALVEHPAESLAIRTETMGYLLHAPPWSGFGTYGINVRTLRKLGLKVDFETRGFKTARTCVDAVSAFSRLHLPLAPVWYVGACATALLAAFLATKRLWRVEALLVAAALLHLVSVILVVSHWEFRWGHQSIFLCSLALCLMIQRGVAGRRAADRLP